MKLREVSYLVLAIIVAEFVIVFPVLFPKHQDTPAIAEATLRGPQDLSSHRATPAPAKPQVPLPAPVRSANAQHAVTAETPRNTPAPQAPSKPVSARFAIAERTEIERPHEPLTIVPPHHAPPPHFIATTPRPAHVAVAEPPHAAAAAPKHVAVTVPPKRVAVAAPQHIAVAAPQHVAVVLAVPKHVAVAVPKHVAVAEPTHAAPPAHAAVAGIKHVAVVVPATAAALSSAARKRQESVAAPTLHTAPPAAEPKLIAVAPRSDIAKPQVRVPQKTQHVAAPTTQSHPLSAHPQNAPRVALHDAPASSAQLSATKPRLVGASTDTRLALRESAPAETTSNVPSRIPSRPNATENAIFQFDATATHLVRGQKTFLCVGIDSGVKASIAGVGRIAAGRTSCHRIAPQHSTTYTLSVERNGVVAERTLHVSVKQTGHTPPSRGQHPKVKHFYVPE